MRTTTSLMNVLNSRCTNLHTRTKATKQLGFSHAHKDTAMNALSVLFAVDEFGLGVLRLDQRAGARSAHLGIAVLVLDALRTTKERIERT